MTPRPLGGRDPKDSSFRLYRPHHATLDRLMSKYELRSRSEAMRVALEWMAAQEQRWPVRRPEIKR